MLNYSNFFLLFITFLSNAFVASSLGCFVCQSYNGSDPRCEDSFANNDTNPVYDENCLSAMRGRQGLYPATACFKMKGTLVADGTKVIIRGCSRDSGSLTMDTELSRIEHTCGLNFLQTSNPKDNGYVLAKFYGCIDVCKDSDGCNSSENLQMKISSFQTFVIFVFFFTLW